jgi:hypothetical protein
MTTMHPTFYAASPLEVERAYLLLEDREVAVDVAYRIEPAERDEHGNETDPEVVILSVELEGGIIARGADEVLSVLGATASALAVLERDLLHAAEQRARRIAETDAAYDLDADTVRR